MGYRRLTVRENGKSRRVFEHVLVWESHHGPVPAGWIIHHKNEDRLDNRIENLEAMSRSDHKRHHVGYKSVDGVPHRPCRKCLALKPLDNFYVKKVKARNGEHGFYPSSTCIPCNNAYNKEVDRKTRAKRGGKWKKRVGRQLYGPPQPHGPRRKISNGSLYLKKEITGQENSNSPDAKKTPGTS